LSNPKPITVTYVATDAYEGGNAPQPFVVVGDAPAPDEHAFREYLRSLPGFGNPFAILTIAGDGENFEWAAI
jgi:hypothetical protein